MTIKKALAEVEKEYERALQLEYVRNPLAWALYRVWRMADEAKTRGRRATHDAD